jgi:preprotein translocase subunit YajC
MKFKSLLRTIALVAVFTILALSLSGCFGVPTTDGAEGSTSGNWIQSILIFAVIIVVFYFFMIRPESKKKKKAKEMRESLSAGDKVTTIGGIMGKIIGIKEESITFETGEDRVRIEVAKWAISSTGKEPVEPQDKPQ